MICRPASDGAAQGVGVAQASAAAHLSGQNEVENEVNPVGRAVVGNRMPAPIIDFDYFSRAQDPGFLADGERDSVVAYDRNVYAV